MNLQQIETERTKADKILENLEPMNHGERMELYSLALTEDAEKKAMALENIRLKEQYLKLN